MATIKFVRGEDRAFPLLSERIKSDPVLAEMAKDWPPEDMMTGVFTHHGGSEEEPQLLEIKFPPNHKNDSHAHDADEIFVVVEGSIKFGTQVYGVGSSVFIPKMTLYSFQAGPEGLTFLNFRPTKSHGAITKDEFMAMRSEKKESRV